MKPGSRTLLDEIVAFARHVTEVPYESFSRFHLLEKPRQITPAEAEAHIAAGWGLTCREKGQLMASFLTARGVTNAIVGGGFEIWHDGLNLLRFKGRADLPPDEAYIAKFFDQSWNPSVYETPIHMSHWANWFELDGVPYLVDTTGGMAPFRFFERGDVARLLDETPKSYVTHMPTRCRMYLHRLSKGLLEAVDRKHDDGTEYVVGKLLATSMLTTEHAFVNPRWWWRDGAFEHDLASNPELSLRISGGEMELVYCQTLSELIAALPDPLPPRHVEALEHAWPALLHWIGRTFDSPRHIRFVVSRTPRPVVSYSSNTLQVAPEAE